MNNVQIKIYYDRNDVQEINSLAITWHYCIYRNMIGLRRTSLLNSNVMDKAFEIALGLIF